MSFVAEMIIAHFNQNCHTYRSSPFFTFAEEQIIKKIIGRKQRICLCLKLYTGWKMVNGIIKNEAGEFCKSLHLEPKTFTRLSS